MRADISEALRGRSVTFWGANREKRKLVDYLYPDEMVHDLAAARFGTTGGRSLLVATDERVLVIKDGWIFRNSQGMGYQDIRSVEIQTGLFFARLQFHGEGMEFEVTKVGRFAADHLVKLIRSRIGSRYDSWKRQRDTLRQQQSQEAFPLTTQPVSQPATTPDEPMTLDAFLAPQNGSYGTGHQPTDNPNVQHLTFPSLHTPSPTPNGDMVTELERLTNLYRNGALSDSEYVIAKQRLFGQ